MKVIYNRLLPFRGFTAINLFGIVFARRECRPLSEVTLRHEAIHTRQMRETGYVGFYLIYIAEWLFQLWRLRSAGLAYHAISLSTRAENVFGNACGTPATDKNCFLVLAGVPQREKSAFWCLRDFRNEEKLLFDACGNPATRKNCFLALAGVPQRGKSAFWCLRESRKHFQKRFGRCGLS